jgi:hypothetical protein
MKISVSGDFNNLERYLKKDRRVSLDQLGKALVEALRAATPTRSGATASAWGYRISKTSRGEELEIFNTNINKGKNIAILIHYGHGTGTGGYVPPHPYIDKAIDSAYKSAINRVLTDYLK